MTIIESARAMLVDPQDRVLLMKLASNVRQTYMTNVRRLAQEADTQTTK